MDAKLFQLPDKTQVPDGISPGDRFQVLATLVLGEDGRSASLVEIDGEEIVGGDDKESPRHEMMEEQGWVEEVSGKMKKGMR